MLRIKRIILASIFVNLASVSTAQIFQLSGRVFESNNNPVEFAEILLVQNDSIFQYQLTGENGGFLINALSDIKRFDAWLFQIKSQCFCKNAVYES